MTATAANQKARLRASVAAWALRLRVHPSGIYVQEMTTKWASCSRTGRLCFSLDLLRQPPSFREAVIVHELLHLRVRNHGKLFTALMSAHLPSWRRTLKNASRPRTPRAKRMPNA